MTADLAGVFGGVDTHKDIHVAAVADTVGRLLGTASFDADTGGCGRLLGWMGSLGARGRVGVEGTGSYGAGLARRLGAAGVAVAEVNRPNREMRRRRGKTDTVDAEAAAVAALRAGGASAPESGDGRVEAIRALSAARRSAIKARTVAANQVGGLIVTAPEHLKDRLRGLGSAAVARACARLRPDTSPDTVTAAAKAALRSLARRHRALTAETARLDAELLSLREQANPALLGAVGVGPEVAAALLTAAGDNPHRMRSEASFAALCGAGPIEASSGHTTRHRLNRGGNRCANNALWRIAMVRMRVDERTIAHAARRRAEGKTKRETIRCLKRHIAREVYRLLTDPPPVPNGHDLRRQSRTATTCADSATAPGSPSQPPHTPSMPPPPRSQHSNEASGTTAASPSATSSTSPKSRLDKHRSVHRSGERRGVGVSTEKAS